MSEQILNTRIQLKYDSWENWQSASSYVLKKGEIGICAVKPAIAEGAGNTNVAETTPSQILMKVGDGTSAFSALPWISAKAADVYDWAKQASLPVTKEGTGNVVTGITWDATSKGLKFTTATMATSAEFSALAGRVTTIETTFATDAELAGAVETINAEIAKKADKTYVDDELAKKLDKTTFETFEGTNATAIATAKSEAIADAKTETEKQVKALADGAVATNTTNITNLTKTVGDNKTAQDAIADRVTAIENAPYATKGQLDAVSAVANAAATQTALNEEIARATKAEEANAGAAAAALAKANEKTTMAEVEAKDYATKTEAQAMADGKDAAIKAAQDAADAAQADIDAFFAAAATGDAALDTLKEIQDFLNSDSGTVQTLIDKVDANESAIEDIIDGTTTVAKATNAEDSAKLGGAVAADYLKKADAPGYADILTKTAAAEGYQPKGDYASAAQGALADTAIQPGVLTTELAKYYTKTAADAEFMNATETDDAIDAKITALKLGETYEPIGAESRAKTYADGINTNLLQSIATAKSEAIEAAAGDATTKANAAETNAKTHATNLNTAMDTRVKSLEDNALTGLTAGDGIAITGSGNTRTIAIDKSVTFVFDCGDSKDLPLNA